MSDRVALARAIAARFEAREGSIKQHGCRLMAKKCRVAWRMSCYRDRGGRSLRSLFWLGAPVAHLGRGFFLRTPRQVGREGERDPVGAEQGRQVPQADI